MTSVDQRLGRIERVLLALGSERLGAPGLGPLDPSYRLARDQARRDLAQIAAEQAEPPQETRS